MAFLVLLPSADVNGQPTALALRRDGLLRLTLAQPDGPMALYMSS